jgi:serine/threonine-protein kinase
MELVEGSDLKGLVNRRGKLPLEVVTAIGIDVARALAFAHRQSYRIHGESYKGLIHRDVKPGNILCSRTGEIKLADFGLAKPGEYNVHTITGNFVGTPKYAAPEQLLSSPLDARSDIYSLGAVLYEMLAGQELFPQESIMSVLAARQANAYKPLTKARKGIQRDLCKIVEKCLSPSPESRFRTATSLLESLEDAHRRLTKERPESVLEDYVIDKRLLAEAPSAPLHNMRRLFGVFR